MDNKKTILRFQIISAFFSLIVGTLLHFTYKWSNSNLFVGSFSAVNESTWEHLKLIFFPMLFTTIIGFFYMGKNVPSYLCAKLIGIVTSIVFTVVVFYTYTGILGTNFGILNILLFIVSVILGEYIAYKIMITNNKFACNNIVAIVFLFLLLASFIIFTYYTPQIGLFKDPITNEYGI